MFSVAGIWQARPFEKNNYRMKTNLKGFAQFKRKKILKDVKTFEIKGKVVIDNSTALSKKR